MIVIIGIMLLIIAFLLGGYGFFKASKRFDLVCLLLAFEFLVVAVLLLSIDSPIVKWILEHVISHYCNV